MNLNFQDIFKKQCDIIPGGTQLLSKNPSMFSENYPIYYSKAKGCDVWDLSGNKYIDMAYMGIGSCVLGFADNAVNKAVKKCIDNGNMSTMNAIEEFELAEKLIDLHPWAGGVRFARTGGESMAVAIRIARAWKKKTKVMVCGYHGWHDWYLAANLADRTNLDNHLRKFLNIAGVPEELKHSCIPFAYPKTPDDVKDFENKFYDNVEDLACIVMEPIRYSEPSDGVLKMIRELCSSNGIILIFDEITSGFRSYVGGIHQSFYVNPDIVVFAKAISNGFPMGAIVGTNEVMHSANDTFISSTYWTEKIGTVAALATIHEMEKKETSLLNNNCHIMKNILEDVSKQVDTLLDIEMNNGLLHWKFSKESDSDITDYHATRQIYTGFMIEEGFIATDSYYASYAHKQEHFDRFYDACSKSFNKLREESVK